MKTSQIARGIVGALSLAGVIGAVGCGAGGYDEGAAGEGEIGETSQALSAVASVASSTIAGREFAASCTLDYERVFVAGQPSETRKVMLVVGGYNSAGTALGDAAMYEPVSNTWFAAASLPGSELRGGAKLINTGAKVCTLVGGSASKGGTSVLPTYTFTSNATTGTWSANIANLPVGRVLFSLDKCGTGGDIIAIGGIDGTTALKSVYKFNGSAWSLLTSLDEEHYGFAYAAEDTNKKFIHSGFNTSAISNKLELLTVDNSCANPVVRSIAIAGAGTHAGGTARMGAVGIRSAANTFVVAAGDDGSSLPTDEDVYAVSNYTSNPPTFTSYTNHTSQVTGVRFPTLALGSTGRTLLIGGEDRSNATGWLLATPVSTLQEFAAAGTAFDITPSLTDERRGAAAELLPNGFTYAFGGKDAASNMLQSVDKITSP